MVGALCSPPGAAPGLAPPLHSGGGHRLHAAMQGAELGLRPLVLGWVQVGVTALGRGLFGGGGKVLALDRSGGCVACGRAGCPCRVTSQVVPIVTLSLPSVNSDMHETSAAGNPADHQRLVGRLWGRWG